MIAARGDCRVCSYQLAIHTCCPGRGGTDGDHCSRAATAGDGPEDIHNTAKGLGERKEKKKSVEGKICSL